MITKKRALKHVGEIRDLQDLKHGKETHTVPEWIIIIRRQVQQAEDAWYVGNKNRALEQVAHVAACGVAALEHNGNEPKK